jgi:hypothetical protein
MLFTIPGKLNCGFLIVGSDEPEKLHFGKLESVVDKKNPLPPGDLFVCFHFCVFVSTSLSLLAPPSFNWKIQLSIAQP